MSLNVLGLSFGHDGSASVVKNGKLIAHIASERITRVKKQRGVNKRVIKYVLDKAKMKLTDIDIVALINWFWDRGFEGEELFDKEEEGFAVITERGIEYSLEDYAEFYRNVSMAAQGVFTIQIGEQAKPCIHVDHHFAHCAYAYFMSPFDDALCFSLDVNDNMGNNHSAYYFDRENHHPIRKGDDFSVGAFYSQICDFLGFYPSLTDAGKVMALAAYKKHSSIANHFTWPEVIKMGDIYHGDQYSHLLGAHGQNMFTKRNLYPQLKGEGGKADKKWLDKKDWNKPLSKQIAADAQFILEQSVHNFIEELEKNFKLTNNLCVVGGTFLNCVMNGMLEKKFPKLNIWAAPACGDDGLSIGASLFISNKLDKNKKSEITEKSKKKTNHTIQENISGGKKYYEKEILETIKDYDEIKYEKPDDLIPIISKELQDEKIVAWFQGESEIGPRALGRRSILADPRKQNMKDILNKKIKKREEFRPFAPLVLEDEADEWFDVKEGKSYPFMLFSLKCKASDEIPAAVHIDGTARIQTVNKSNGAIYDLLYQFAEDTDIPVLINTSFNTQGQPIVEDPEDAIETFLDTEIDILVLEKYIVRKK